jgi:hypothetical protein
MKTRVPTNQFSERRLDKATKHVTNLWFPINPSILEEIRERFRNGAFDDRIEALLEALKKDFALFTFIVKELMPVASNERVPRDVTNNPAELLRWAGPTRIKNIIFDDQVLPSNHVFNSIEPFQADRLRETAIIASTAEVLSEKHNLDPETGFCRGVIREIGLNLIAWNYPSLYSRVVKNLTPNRSLDEELTSELGFSPSLLAMRVLRPDVDAQKSDDAFEQTWATYDQLCEVGEALARAENPATYPSAENDWRLASAYLEKTVGNQGIDLIKNRAMEHSREYQRSLVSSFQPIEDFNPAVKVEHFKQQQTALKNRYLQHCSPEVQNALKDLYADMTGKDTLGQVLERLFRGIIPEAGFTGGCVFVVDPASFALMPRTVFGTVRLRALEQITLRRGRSGLNEPRLGALAVQSGYESDSAATALSCSQPVIERPEDDNNAAFTGMYGSLGESRRIGVLYLELPEGADIASDAQSLGTFKAMRQALSDALRLD